MTQSFMLTIDMGGALDKALSAFIEDIEQRGLRDKLLLVVTGEMGRTPKINKDGGRDHWGKLSPLLLYGGAVKRGTVIGASDRRGGEPDREPCEQEHLLATIMHSAFDIGKLRVARDMPATLLRQIESLTPIPGALET